MNRFFTRLALPGVLLAGLAFAQAPAAGDNSSRDFRKGMRARQGVRAANFLQLTDAQKAEIKAIHEAAKPAVQPLRDRMRTARQELAAAVQNNAPANEIDRISNEIGTVSAQLTSAEAKTRQKVLQVLTPEQRAKMEQARQDRAGRRQGGFRNLR